jgi:hypothetical protein
VLEGYSVALQPMFRYFLFVMTGIFPPEERDFSLTCLRFSSVPTRRHQDNTADLGHDTHYSLILMLKLYNLTTNWRPEINCQYKILDLCLRARYLIFCSCLMSVRAISK